MNEQDLSMERREWLKKAGLLLTAAAAAGSMNAMAQPHDHMHHHRDEEDGQDRARQALIDKALECVKTGEACNQHCIELVRSGDTTIAGCMDSVQEVLAACTALSKLAAHDSKYLRAMVQMSMDICADCEKECRKHASKHEECRACADSCGDCYDACQAYLNPPRHAGGQNNRQMGVPAGGTSPWVIR